MRLILASASPRRRDLLDAAGLRFEVEPADVDERTDEQDPVLVAEELAAEKARTVAGRHRGAAAWVLGADTVVAVEIDGCDHLLGKPADATEARAMLARLSGRVQRVVTGLAVVDARSGELWGDHELTRVTMREITRDEATAYVASGEWRGKAGGYAIQETADRFVIGLEGGGFDNVVGLPVGRVQALLRRAGAPPEVVGPPRPR